MSKNNIHKGLKAAALLFVFQLYWGMLYAQEYAYRHFQTRDGLIGNHVYHVIQDKEYNLWFATETGVSKYNGVQFINFTTKDGLPDNDVIKLFEDSKGRIWMMSIANQLCYYFQGEMHHAGNDSLLKKINIINFVFQITEDKIGNLYFIEQYGNFFAITPQNKIIYLQENNYELFDVGLAQNNRVEIFATKASLPTNLKYTSRYVVKLTADSLQIQLQQLPYRFFSSTASSAIINKESYVTEFKEIINVKTQVVRFDKGAQGIERIPIETDFNTITFCNKDTFFINSKSGVYVYANEQLIDKLLTSEDVTCTFTDKENNLWITTTDNGVFQLYTYAFKQMPINPKNNSSNYITAIGGDENFIIWGSKEGDLKYHQLNQKLQLNNKFPGLLNSGRVAKIIKYQKKFYILYQKGLVELDEKLQTNKIIIQRGSRYSFKDFVITANGDFLMATHLGLVKYSNNFTKNQQLTFDRISSVVNSDSGIYIANNAGIHFLKDKGVHVELSGTLTNFNSNAIVMIASKGLLWVGSRNDGIYLFQRRNMLKHLTSKDGLLSDAIKSIWVDGDFIWVGTSNGVTKLAYQNGTIKVISNYTQQDGLIGNYINSIVVQANQVFIATDKGVSILNEKLIDRYSICFLQDPIMQLGANRYKSTSSKVFLKPQTEIQFHFVAVSFKSTERMEYFYRIIGLQNEWIKTTENTLSYPSLPNGSYTFEIYAQNKYGIKSQHKTISFYVEKRWFEKTGYLICMILLMLGLMGGYIQYMKVSIGKKQRLQAEMKIRLSELEQKAMRAQMNPHFIFNCLNSIQYFVIEKDFSGVNKFISKFSGLIRKTLDYSSRKFITIEEEVQYLQSYLDIELHRFEGKFDYTFDIDENIQQHKMMIPPMLLQPFVENAINHGILHKKSGVGHINVSFHKLKNSICCTISDNGIGRAAAMELKQAYQPTHQSTSTIITEQRIQMLKEATTHSYDFSIVDLVDEDGKFMGTKVILDIPILIQQKGRQEI